MQKTFLFRQTAVAYEDVCGISGQNGGGAAPKRLPVVVLIHGFAEDGTVWRHQVAALGDNYRFIVPDLPGSGLSPRLKEGLSGEEVASGEEAGPGGESPSLETFAALIYALLQHEKVERCCMIGHSMGGYITLAFAEQYAEYLDGFGLFHSTAFGDSEEKKQTRRKSITFIRENGALPFLRQSTPNLFAESYKQTQGAQVEALLQRNERFDPEALTDYYSAMLRRPDRRDVMAKSAVPVLVIAGKQDNAVPLKESLQLVTLAETTFVYIMDRVAHMGMWEAVPESNKALQEYLTFVFRNY